ncbi:MAG: Mini-ribonuclease 3 [Clostridia bacterium]|nr:Mini-ribonuclease 3 [Clostridia bacterium]
MNIEAILKDGERPDVRELSSLSLAFIGDSVYELYVRTKILQKGSRPANELHKIAVGYVKAKAQSLAMHEILDSLTEEEIGIYKRGRNTHIHTVPKNADMNEYRQATGLEALVGYLYITGQSERLNEVLEAAFAAISRA